MRRFLPLLLIALLASGCSLFNQPPRFIDDGASQEIERLRLQEEGIASFRGTGSMALFKDGTHQRFRMAWVGKKPNKLRLEILAAGTPMESVAYDGTRLMLRSANGAHPFYKETIKNPSLEPITGVPLALNEIYALLSGVFHIGEFKDARLLFDEEGSSKLVVRPDWASMKSISLDSSGRVKNVSLTRGGKPIYTVELTANRKGGYKKIRIVAKANRATLTIDRVETGVTVPETAFTLSP